MVASTLRATGRLCPGSLSAFPQPSNVFEILCCHFRLGSTLLVTLLLLLWVPRLLWVRGNLLRVLRLELLRLLGGRWAVSTKLASKPRRCVRHDYPFPSYQLYPTWADATRGTLPSMGLPSSIIPCVPTSTMFLTLSASASRHSTMTSS